MSKLDELVREANEFFEDFSVTASDFQQPTPFFFKTIFSRLMEEFQVDISNVNKFQMQECSPEDIDVLGDINFLVALRQVFPFLNIGLFDILHPEPKKTIDAFSKALKYYWFCDERLGHLNEAVKEHKIAKRTLLETLKRKELISIKLNEVAMEKDGYDEQLNDLKNQVKDKLKILPELERKVSNMQDEGKILKTKEKEIDSNITALGNEILRLKSAIDTLEKSIVTNPEVEQNNLQLKQTELKKINEKRNNIYEKIKEKSDYKRQLHLISSALTEVLESNQVFDLIRVTESKKKNLAQLKNELSNLKLREKTKKDVDQLTAMIEKEQICLKEKLNELNMKKNRFISSIEEAKRSYTELMSKKSQEQNKYTDLQNELKFLDKREEELENTMVSHIAMFNKVIEKTDKIVSNTVCYKKE